MGVCVVSLKANKNMKEKKINLFQLSIDPKTVVAV
jgi:hypothetical protein